MRTKGWVCLLCVFLLLAAAGLSFGQTSSSAISGVVKDSSEAVIGGANVTVANVETGLTRSVQSDSQGRYRLGELAPGTYQISISVAGFAKETRKGIVLTVGQDLPLNFALQIGTVEQEVVVTGAAPVIETSTAAVAASVSQEQLRELPLNGRSFINLVTLETGAVTPSSASGSANYGNGPQLSISGSRTDSNNFMIDGTDMGNSSNGTPGSAAGVQLGVDTIREYQVITSNAKAEYGRNSGGIINAVSRSGTNEWHGSAFEFLRNSKLDARNFFDLATTPPFKRNQFGATFGGAIKKEKTFFFLGYEGLRQRLSSTFTYIVPTASARRGNLSSGTVPVDPRIVPYLALYPLPNGAILAGGDTGQYVTAISQPTTEDYGSVRIDHNFSSNDVLFGRYTTDKANSVTGQATILSNQFYETSNQYLTIQEDHIFGPVLLNTFRAGFNRSVNNEFATQVPDAPLSLGFVSGQPIGQLNVGGLSILGPMQITRLVTIQNAFQFQDDITYTRGAHTLKLGAVAERFQWNSDQPAFIQGNYSFSNLQNFLQAGPVGTAATLLLPQSSTVRGLRSTLMGFYAQDDFKVTPSLTLNYGLRWEFTTGLKEVNGLISHLTANPNVATLNDLATGSLFDNHIRIFESRFGFNWAIGKSQKTVVSGGFGIFHNQILSNAFVSYRAQLPFYFRGTFPNLNATSTFPNIQATIASVAKFLVTREFDSANFKTPTTNRFNLTLQRQLPGEMVLRIGYVGATTFHLAAPQSLNTFPAPIKQADGSLFFPASPVPQQINPNFNMIEWMSSGLNSHYNALAVTFQKRFSRGVSFQVSYTWSKSIDDYSQSETNYTGATGRNPEFAWDRSLDRGLSSFNVPQALVVNGIYDLPMGPGKRFLNSGIASTILGGWEVGGIVTVQKGLPFTVGSSATAAGYVYTANRPNLKSGTKLSSLTGGPPSKYFDASAFYVPAPGTIGNAARNLLIGPPLSTLNLNLSKSFSLGERFKLQFRGEFFNLINHTNFSNPLNAVIFTSQSGAVSPAGLTITSTSTSSRQIQMGLKLSF